MSPGALPWHQVLPVPGPLWGPAPQRPDDAGPPPWRWPRWGGARGQAWRVARAAARIAAAVPAAELEPGRPEARQALARLRQALRRGGLRPALQARALGQVAALAGTVLGTRPYPGQLFAAAALLEGHLVEMATGEGKTLATALAATVGALAGLPVHVVTANDYLAGRDAAALAPLGQALDLRVAHLAPEADADTRRAVYAHDLVYATARELAFDHLRDQLAAGPRGEPLALLAARLAGDHTARPVQRGLCLALLDEADSILLDEAEMPLVLSQPRPPSPGAAAQRALWFQALALARQLAPDTHCQLLPALRRASLTAAGRARLATLAAGLGGPWARPAWREELAETALAGLHLLQRERHYLVRDGAVQLLDEVTGRAAPGRVWTAGLQAVVALKEGLKPDAGTDTVARTTYPRFFQRYWRLAGLSGTLTEARAEFAEVYGLRVLPVPLHRPSQRRQGPTRHFPTAQARWQAVVQRCARLHAAGRPVLVGTDSVADSRALAAQLAAAGLPHRVLDALHDADEAATVAAAGRAGAVTVATRMAGRGTDIALDDAARAAGGLHVINCQRNPSARLDRQLAGRSARHGDPGSTETWLGPGLSDDPTDAPLPKLPAWTHGHNRLLHALARLVPTRWLSAWQAARHASWQRQQERQRRARRRALAAQDRDWAKRLAFSGRSAD